METQIQYVSQEIIITNLSTLRLTWKLDYTLYKQFEAKEVIKFIDVVAYIGLVWIP